MNSLIGIISASFVFSIFFLIGYLLIKKNIFSPSKSEKTQNNLKSRNTKLSKLEKLEMENEDLTNQIKFLESKNRRLRIKIEQMKKVIDELKEQKMQLEKSQNKLEDLRAQKDETLAMVAHDLKNPASTIKSFVELLESYDLSAQEQQDVFKSLMETSLRLVNLAEEFSQVISEEYVPFNLSKKPTKLKDVIEGIVKVNRVKAGKKNIEIRLYQPETDFEVNVDPEKIKEVIDNFVGNAVKFCPEKSKVDVFTKVSNNEIIVEVIDNGFGLTENEISSAFEKGIKLSTKPTAGESSSGLGLWIAKKIIEEHDGRVYVKSKKGYGSTFAFTLPLI